MKPPSALFAIGARNVHPNRTNTEPGDTEVPAGLSGHGVGDRQFHQRGSGPHLTSRRTALLIAGSNRRISRCRFRHGDEERRWGLVPAEAGDTRRHYGAFYRRPARVAW